MSLKADAEPNNNVSIEEEASAQLFVIYFLFGLFSFYALAAPFTHSAGCVRALPTRPRLARVGSLALKPKKRNHFSSLPGRSAQGSRRDDINKSEPREKVFECQRFGANLKFAVTSVILNMQNASPGVR